MNQYNYTIPEHFLNYFVNAETEGLSETDLININTFEALLISTHGHCDLCYTDTELGFKKYNDVDNLGDNCYLMVILELKQK